MQAGSAPPEMGAPLKNKPGHWVQTEKRVHEIWAQFAMKKPTASAVLHQLIAHMGAQNAVVISQKLLAESLGVTDRTIRTALSDLAAGHWIQVVRIGKGKEAAYVINDRVAWDRPRDDLRFSIFSASVVADSRDQDPETMDDTPLRRVPVLYARRQPHSTDEEQNNI